jgi:hypothetical protein
LFCYGQLLIESKLSILIFTNRNEKIDYRYG